MSIIGIERVEKDKSQAIRSVAGDPVGMVLQVPYGPIKPVLVSGGDEESLIKLFTENSNPDPDYKDLYEALLILRKSPVWACRPQVDAKFGGYLAFKAGTGNSNEALTVGFDNPATYTFPSNDYLFLLYGADPSTQNNQFKAKVKTATQIVASAFSLELYKGSTLLGDFLVSLRKTAVDGFGNSIYIENVLNGRYDVNVLVNQSADLTLLPVYDSAATYFGGGTDLTSFSTPADTVEAWDNFKDYNKYLCHILADFSCNPTIASAVNQIAVANWYQHPYFGAPSIKATNPISTESLSTWRQSALDYRDVNGVELALNSDHGSLYANWCRIKDKFNGGTLWVSPVGQAVARKMYTANQVSMSQAAVGANSNRGVCEDVVELEQDVSTIVDDLGNYQINCLSYSPAGPVVWNEWTLQTAYSNTSFISHRVLFNIMEENIERQIFYFVFTDINQNTRDDLKRFVETYTNTLVGIHADDIQVRVPQDDVLAAQRKMKLQVGVIPYAKANKIIFEFIHAGPGGVSLSEVF